MPDDLSGLLDQFGQPIPRSVLASMREEIASTDALQGRPPFAPHLAARMRPERLGAVLRAADSGSSLEWRILEEEIEELFPHYYAVLSKRRRNVCQLPITVRPAGDDAESERHAEFITDWLEQGILAEALYDITDAIGKGCSVIEIVWDSGAEGVTPAKLIHREARHFEISWHDGETLWLRTGAAATPGNDGFPSRSRDGVPTYAPAGFAELARHKFIQHRHRSKSGLTIRAGLTRAVCFLWMHSAFTLRDWALFSQAYGFPIRVGRYGPEASQSDKNVLWRAVSSIAGDVAAMIPKSMEIEFVKDTDRRAGSELYERRLDWLNREVSKLVLGSTAGTEAISGGHAVGRQHRQVEQDIERFDGLLLGATLTRQLVQPMIAFTFGPQRRYPVLMIGQPDQVPLNEFTQGVAAMLDRGLTVRAREVRERYGLTAPEPGDEKLQAKAASGSGPKLPEAQAPDDPEADLQAARPFLGRLLTLQAEASPELVERLTERVAAEAAGALAGMTGRVRRAFEEATDMRDLAHRLAQLHLPQQQFAEAMARGMALAHLAGQAELLDEVGLARHARLDARERDDLADDDFAVPGKRKLPIHDRSHVEAAWREVDRTEGLTPAERAAARRRIKTRAKRLGIDTSG